MKKKFLSVLVPGCLCVFVSAAGAESVFVVEKGKTRVITKDQSRMLVDTLIMEPDSTIKFAPDVRKWELHARRAVFRHGAKILGRGEPGKQGADAEGKPQQADYCRTGRHGYNGANGQPGKDGVSVSLTLGIVALDDLYIDVGGGRGGDGGRGGKGGQGGAANGACTCAGGVGGYGGNGGNGGSGGNGGDIVITYWNADKDAPFNGRPEGEGLRFSNAGGAGGMGGHGGPGGDSGGGRVCFLIRQGSDCCSAPGRGGMPGARGGDGAVTIRAIPHPGP